MEGMSDMFAFLADNANSAPHSQLSFDNIENNRIIGEAYGNDEELITESEQIAYHNKLLADRHTQDKMFKAQIDTFMKQQYK